MADDLAPLLAAAWARRQRCELTVPEQPAARADDGQADLGSGYYQVDVQAKNDAWHLSFVLPITARADDSIAIRVSLATGEPHPATQVQLCGLQIALSDGRGLVRCGDLQAAWNARGDLPTASLLHDGVVSFGRHTLPDPPF